MGVFRHSQAHTRRLAIAAVVFEAATIADGFVTNAEETRHFAWTSTTRTASQALAFTFPQGGGWIDACFAEAGCSSVNPSNIITRESLATWVEGVLLATDPFPQAGQVPVPWPTGSNEASGDQLGFKQYVGYTRRQVCYIAAKTLLGAGTQDYDNGLTRMLNKTVPGCGPAVPSVPRDGFPEPGALTGDFGTTTWQLLAACAADPTLRNGEQGPLVLVAKGSDQFNDAAAAPSVIKQMGQSVPLKESALAICRYDDGNAGPMEHPMLEEMPRDICTPPTVGAPGRDFMTGGAGRKWGQAMQDISAQFFGGYVFGNACGLGGGQDERLMTYLPEVFVLSFFLSRHPDFPQLRQPAWILGARLLFIGLDGPARHNTRLELDMSVPLQSDLESITIGSSTYLIGKSAPFLAFMSENQDFLREGDFFAGTKTYAEIQNDLHLARRNRHPLQREISDQVWHSFMYQVRSWYMAVALTSYSDEVQPTLRSLVTSLGAGPFVAGLWWGDSHLGFLAVWIAHAIAATTWSGSGLPLQYYIYAAFTENPGNQCFQHSNEACKTCLKRCADDPLPTSAFWLPDYAFFGEEDDKSCVINSDAYCGQKGIEDILTTFGNMNATELWNAVEQALSQGPQTQETVFDLMLGVVSPTPAPVPTAGFDWPHIGMALVVVLIGLGIYFGTRSTPAASQSEAARELTQQSFRGV